MKKMFLFFSHRLTYEQEMDARESFFVEEFIYLPKELQEKWSNVPPELEDLSEYALLFFSFLEKNAKKGDFALIQGDFGLTYKMVNFAKSIGVIPVYATTKRVVKEIKNGDKIIKQSQFKHIRFRKY
ncbi:MAG: CRISPR-associated protein Csx20 [Nautiliaceae bacterium]